MYNSIYFMNIQVFFQKLNIRSQLYRILFSPVGEPIRHNIRMGDGDFNVFDFLFAEKTQFLRLGADVKNRLLREIIAVDHVDHPPDTAVPVGGDPAGIVVDCQFDELLLGNPDAQFLI